MRTDAQRERARQYYAENRERVLELDRARRQRNPERAPEIRRACYFRNHEKRLAYHRGRFARGQSWAQRNPERTRERDRAYQKVYYLDHRAEQAVRNAAWIQSNPDRVAHNSATRRAREYGADGSHTLQEWLDKCVLLGNVCFYCGEDKTLVRDHKVPLTRGGTNDIRNIVPACRSCNSRKHTMTVDEFGLVTEREKMRPTLRPASSSLRIVGVTSSVSPLPSERP